MPKHDTPEEALAYLLENGGGCIEFPMKYYINNKLVFCPQCQDTGKIERYGGTPLPCECSSVKYA